METPITGPVRALVIDDQNMDSINALDKLLESLGCDVTTCQVRSEGVVQAQRTSPHLILLDIVTGKNGLDVAEDLQNADLPSFYLVALSEYGGKSLRECCNAVGFDKHILKPTCPDQLRELVVSARRLADYRALSIIGP
jgi:two-component system, sensor histidine kinase and response regulator